MGEKLEVLFPVLQITPTIRKTLENVVQCKCISEVLKLECTTLLDQESDNVLIPTKTVREVYNTLRNEGHKVFLHEIVENADIIPQSLKLPLRSPELEARIRKLQIIQENKDYERMTRNLRPRSKVLSFQQEVKSMNKQLITVFNFFLTVIAGFAFGFKSSEMFFSDVLAMKMLAGLGAGLVVFFVDLYFLMKYGMKD